MPQLALLPLAKFTVMFFLIALAAKQIGAFFSRYGLPYITGYLLAGALAGPFILGMMPSEATDTLRYVDDVSLAVIAFIAGSELYLKELQDRLRGILLNAAGIVVAALTLISVQVWRSGTDPLSASIAAVVIAAIVIAQMLWQRPPPLLAAGLIVGATVM